MNPTFHFLLFLLFSLFSTPSVSDPRATLVGLVCVNKSASESDKQSFKSNFLSSLHALTPQIASKRYGKTVNGSGSSTVYAFGECMKDLSQTDCDECFATCKTDIYSCYPFQTTDRGGRTYLDGCYLRYDDYDFFQEPLSSRDSTVCGKRDFNGNLTVYKSNAMKLVRNLSLEAPKNDGFFVGSVRNGNSRVYGLAQCWKFVNRSSCGICLDNATLAIASCLHKDEGRVLNAGCYLRYSPEKFYYNNSGSSITGGGGGHLSVILAVVFSVLAAFMILAASVFYGRMKLAKRRKERKQFGALAATLKKSDLNFKYEVLESATNFFNSSNKLGQGGSGSVYKGILPGGKVVAVKRLVFTTRQWAEQFFNEVNLISDINHKNLVKLLGCSITGPESLLVYEYVPNQSLQDHLFSNIVLVKSFSVEVHFISSKFLSLIYLLDLDKDKSLLSWEVRCNIIIGTAEGLAYLHEESKLRIIHRDIKLSNVLLDENFKAKIADFGLVRLFPADQTHISTGVAGTLGYMAPEYIIHGKLTEKVDVYSFGVLLIEVISGRRNNYLAQDSGSILQMVWNYYVSGSLFEVVDARLKGSAKINEESRVLQIGLLCIQASAELRPSMSMVVKMFTGNHDIPKPTQPPFLNSTSIGNSFLAYETCGGRLGSDTNSAGNSMTESLIEL